MKLHQSGNKIIVTELNPMSDAPMDGSPFLAAHHMYTDVKQCRCCDADLFDYDGIKVPIETLTGWLPMPVYEPSQTQPDDFNRGVRVMFDYLQTRIANNFSGNREANAQLEQINKTLEEWLSDALQEVSPEDYQEWLSLHQAYAAGAEKYKLGHARYEKLRKLNAWQLGQMHLRNLSGENFDEMVDKL